MQLLLVALLLPATGTTLQLYYCLLLQQLLLWLQQPLLLPLPVQLLLLPLLREVLFVIPLLLLLKVCCRCLLQWMQTHVHTAATAADLPLLLMFFVC